MSKRLDSNKFNFFVEADIKKGKDEKGNDLITIDGIASTSSTDDSDGETLFPSGFNLQPFLESGLVNYNHQGSKDSNANIGVPIEAKVINNGRDLYVKCVLWPCPQTDGIMRAAENFKKYNLNRKIGFSIEGQSTLRGSAFKENPLYKKILKADITGLAVTFQPKNKNTLMNIVKGEYDKAFIDPIVDEEEEENDIEKMDVEGIRPAMPESVEHDPKDISNKKNSNFGKLLKKSDIYTQIAQRYPQTSIAEQINIYSFVEQVNSKIFKMEVTKVTPEALQKAFSLLDEAHDLIKGNGGETNTNTSESTGSTGDLTKGEDEKKFDWDSDDMKKAVDHAKFLQKAGMEKEMGCDVMTKGGFALEVSQASWEKALSETQSQQNGGEPATQEVPIMKAEEITGLIKSEIDKTLNPVNINLSKTNEIISKGFEGLGTIVKSLQEQNQELASQNKLLIERVENIEKTPNVRKSLTNVQFVDKFNKSNTPGDLSGKDVYDVTKAEDLERLSDRLFEEHKTALEKGHKEDAALFEGTINAIEISKAVPQFAYRKLAAMNIVLQVPPKN